MPTTPTQLTLTAQCLCKAHTFSVTIPTTDLPLTASCCHCTSCRRSSGALFTCDVDWPGDAADIRASSLERYRFSEGTDILFCGQCGRAVFYEQKKGKGQGEETTPANKVHGVFTDALHLTLTPPTDTIPILKHEALQITEHIFVGDTLDGGATSFLSGPSVRIWFGRREVSQEIMSPYRWARSAPASRLGCDRVSIRCHCKGVDLVLEVRDALRICGGEAKEALALGSSKAKNDKLKGIADGGNSCGLDVMPWVITPLQYISFGKVGEGEAEFPRTASALRYAVDRKCPGMGTLCCYVAPSGARRYFCGRCSAAVFLAEDEEETVKLAVGLLDSPDGALARGIVSWDFEGFVVIRARMVGLRSRAFDSSPSECHQWRLCGIQSGKGSSRERSYQTA
ncbi:hypothetical protein QBC34DRAFT_304237 [Podospora aff. communis PSN243]|uniref:CENP-V/GFA domain-containing protein n=1 Tax=Podospora aff. communis PSN243 TaxID=3040156 RepID=A0AAV9GEK3_9PEZI|nr:hypothetical protein QBC34DRAFT_304237 [Podospora aff. communis PSN243]